MQHTLYKKYPPQNYLQQDGKAEGLSMTLTVFWLKHHRKCLHGSEKSEKQKMHKEFEAFCLENL